MIEIRQIQSFPVKFVKTNKTPFFLSLVILFLLLSNGGKAVHAQASTTFDSVEVLIKPDPVHSVVNVLMQIHLPEAPQNTADLSLRLPSGVALEMLAAIDADGAIAFLDYAIHPADDWQTIQFSSPAQTLLVSYQDPNLEQKGGLFQYHFVWPADHAVTHFSLAVQQPGDNTTLTLEPVLAPVAGQPSVFRDEWGPIEIGETIALTLQYEGPTTRVVEAASPVTANTAGRSAAPTGVVQWLLALGLVVIFLVGLYFAWSRQSQNANSEAFEGAVPSATPEKQVLFCHECGMRSKPGDTYCRSCGTELRRIK